MGRLLRRWHSHESSRRARVARPAYCGGGAGGLSVALLYTKTKPTLKDTTTSAGSAGVGGVPSSNDGIAGDSKTELEIK